MFFGNLRRVGSLGLSAVLVVCTSATSIVFAQKGREKARENDVKNLQEEIRGLLQGKISEKDIAKTVFNAVKIALGQSMGDETIKDLKVEIKKTLLQKKINERTIKKIISSAIRIAFASKKWEKAVKSLKVEMKKGIRHHRICSKKTSTMSKEEIDRISTKEIEDIISGIEDEEILKRIISDKVYCLDLLNMATFDLEKQSEEFYIGLPESQTKTELGLNILVEDRLKLREVLIKEVQNRISSIDCLSNINRRTIEKFMNEFIWTFSNDFCGDVSKDECVLGEVADAFIKKYDAELIATDKEDKLESEKIDVMIRRALDRLTSKIEVSQDGVPNGGSREDVYLGSNLPNNESEFAKHESEKLKVNICGKPDAIISKDGMLRSYEKGLYFDTL